MHSFSWGVTNPVAGVPGAGVGGGEPTFQELSFVHSVDKASPKLMQACATGKHLKEAIITQRRAGAGQQEFLIIMLSDVLVIGVMDATTAGHNGSETVRLAFGKVHLEYKPQKADGSLDSGIDFTNDLKANREG